MQLQYVCSMTSMSYTTVGRWCGDEPHHPPHLETETLIVKNGLGTLYVMNYDGSKQFHRLSVIMTE